MSAQQKAEALGIEFQAIEPGYLNLCIRSGNHAFCIRGIPSTTCRIDNTSSNFLDVGKVKITQF